VDAGICALKSMQVNNPVPSGGYGMAQPYIGEIRMAGFNFAPVDWALCNGQTLAIDQNPTLFQLIGTTYGGDGVSTFNLPNLQSRIPFHQGTQNGNTLVLGQIAGTETVTLLGSQIPTHSHVLQANNVAGNQPSPASDFWAGATVDTLSTGAPTVNMSAVTTLPTGQSQPHDNLPPFLVINFIIALYGIYPSQG
jgi:microcystin-dependent protein